MMIFFFVENGIHFHFEERVKLNLSLTTILNQIKT